MLENNNPSQIEKDTENDTYKMDHPSALTKGQKVAAATLAFFAFLIVIVWSIQLKSSIGNPRQMEIDAYQNNSQEGGETATCSGPDCPLEEELKKTKDTDGDGLWDWDEENVYGTSAYLEDSDSDGILDKEEIDNGTDPNCAGTDPCVDDMPVSDTTTNILDNERGDSVGDSMSQAEMLELLNQLESNETPLGETPETGDQQMQDLLGGKADVTSLRVILKNSGVETAILDSLSDEELLEVYQDMLK